MGSWPSEAQCKHSSVARCLHACKSQVAATAGPTLLPLLPLCALAPLCRAALACGASPDLAAALQGVTHAKLFLAGEVVREGLAVQELIDQAAQYGVNVVLPSAQGLDVVGAAPAMQL